MKFVITADTKVFGETLELGCMHSPVNYHPFLPDIAYKCLIYLFEKGTNEEGLFRLSGSVTTIKQFREGFDGGLDPDLNSCYDPHAISGLLKMYLRELPDSILPGTLYIIHEDQANEHLRTAVQKLSPVVKCLLTHLMRLLHEVAANTAITKMTVNNLAIVFCPTLHCSSEVLMYLVHNADEIFLDEDVLMASAAVPTNNGENLIDMDFGEFQRPTDEGDSYAEDGNHVGSYELNSSPAGNIGFMEGGQEEYSETQDGASTLYPSNEQQQRGHKSL